MAKRNRGNGLQSFLIFITVFLLVIVLALGGMFFMLKRWLEGDFGGESTAPDPSLLDPIGSDEHTGGSEQTTAAPPETAETPETTAAPVQSTVVYEEKSVTEADVHTGDVILVSRVYEYVFPEKSKVTEVYGKRSVSYQLSSATIKLQKKVITALNEMLDDFVEQGGNDDLIVTGGYRDKTEQQEKYNDYVTKHGEEQNAVSAPGAADRHTGLGVDLKVYNDQGVMFSLDESEVYSWVSENCHKYGFVLRYPKNKTDLTGISYTEAKYFRYVGKPHAEIMTSLGMCLEEYVMHLRSYSYAGEHLLFTSADGTEYELYHIPFDSTSPKIAVPKDREYTLSGDNIDGFFVCFAR
ncbi:MAG: D-alanyl-D-alanine carboxypeptidase family protein [Ruminococcaceae bacterium]|nr:D-alanyl-D-alanine carboxypeptidase family protein [Oscillospiraceae bacterium]